MKNLHHIGFLIFLIVYSYHKYNAVPSLMGQTSYILTSCLLVILTAIIPFYLSISWSNKTKPPSRYVLAGITPLLLSTLGLTAYFYLFIAPNAPGISIIQVLPRAILPGLVMGMILVASILVKEKFAKSTGENGN